MFRFWKLFGNTEEQTEGVSIQYGRDFLIYRSDGRRMLITIDAEGDPIVIFSDTIGRWDDDPGTRIGEDERTEILNEIKWYMTGRGHSIQVLD